jgi:hypothetical protein
MESPRIRQVTELYRVALFVMILTVVGGVAFALGIASSEAAEAKGAKKEPRVVYPKRTDLDFEGVQLEGEVRNPGEFYFQHRPQEKFDSLVKRRKNFHREMLRDVVLSK